MIPHRYKLAPEEDATRAEELGKLVARRPEWRLEPRPAEAVPPSLEAFLAAVACGSADDTIRRTSAKDGFLINTSPPQTNEQKERKKERKCVKPQCAKIVE